MADLAQIETAMATVCAGALFPSASYAFGAYQASTPAGITMKLYRGWPEAANLDVDLLAGKGHVSVFSDPRSSRVTDPHLLQWQTTQPAVTLTTSVSGRVVTFAGTGSASQVAGVLLGTLPNATAYVYELGANDTPATTAAALAALISGASASGAALTLPGTLPITARTAANGTGMLETRRQMQIVRVSCWCPTPAARDAVAGAIDTAFANMTDAYGNFSRFITAADGTAALVRYGGTNSDDKPSRDRTWRRDLTYSVEYPTALVQAQPAMLWGDLIYNSGSLAA